MSYLLKDAHDPRAMRPADLTDIVNQAFTGGLAVEPGTIDVLAERGKQWGDAYKQISGDWAELLGIHTSTEQFIAMMIVLKLRRWRNSGYAEKDCLTDIIGYAKLALN